MGEKLGPNGLGPDEGGIWAETLVWAEMGGGNLGADGLGPDEGGIWAQTLV